MSLTKRMMDEIEEATGIPIIFAYTDEMALDDGVLIDITSISLTFEGKPVNRITSALFYQERPKYPLSEADLAQHLDACGDDEEPINIDMAALAVAMAARLTAATGEGYLRTLPDSIWLVENEIGGWTLMTPSDY